MLRQVVFLLGEYENMDWRQRLTTLTANLAAHGVGCVFAECTAETVCNPGEPQQAHREQGEDEDGLLYVADSAAVCRALSDEGRYVLPYRHECNQAEVFENGRYFYLIEQLEEMDYEGLDMAYRRLAGLPWEILTTERCIIRETTVEDVDAFYRIYAEPSVTAYMENLYADREEESAYVQDYIRNVYYFYGYGMWTVTKKDGQVIGRAGISWREGFQLPELGFVIGVPWQRQGYAYEVCSAILAYAREELGMNRVQALVSKDNEKSAGLCSKLGFLLCGETRTDGETYAVWERTL